MIARLGRMGFVILLGLSLALTSRPQNAPDHTLGLLNGRWWKDAPDIAKLGFVTGYAEHGASTNCSNDEWFKSAYAYGEIRESLDDFYREPANSAVPIHDAWKIIVMKFNGKSSAEIQRQTELARQAASADK
jgi:hypothetical protein